MLSLKHHNKYIDDIVTSLQYSQDTAESML